MRRLFAQVVLEEMKEHTKFMLVTADMGYGLWDTVRDRFPQRFFNVGSAEQLMIGTAAGMAMEGKVPICYSITPFLLYRPFEFIRNFANHEKLPIKLAGGGRNRDYGYLGFTHWAEEDEEIMKVLKNIKFYKPLGTESDLDDFLKKTFREALHSPDPCYINLKK